MAINDLMLNNNKQLRLTNTTAADEIDIVPYKCLMLVLVHCLFNLDESIDFLIENSEDWDSSMINDDDDIGKRLLNI
ncbi:unnamed protein product [Rotaria sordida]|nr:unnamed protein product [Rotaria sordida]CAF3909434.1 unnamed protein product [Rotaria sordida]